MRILIPTIMYRRWSTFKVFEQGIKDLQEAFPEHEISCLVVGSGDSEVVEFEYHDFPNQPLTHKAQYRLKLSRDRADYYLFLGSDDVISVDTFRYYLDRIKEGYEWIAPLDLYAWKGYELYHSLGYTADNRRFGESLAVGRMLSNNVLNKVGWKLWNVSKVKNIDREAYQKLLTVDCKRHFFRLENRGGFICDIKTPDNISKWHDNWRLIGHQSKYFNNKMCDLLNEI